MVLHDQRIIPASLDRVWEILSNPESMAMWNPKCVSCNVKGSKAYKGLRYSAVFKMSGSERNVECEIVALEPEHRMVIRHVPDASQPLRYVDETFFLESMNGGSATRVRHEVDMARAPIPLWLRCLAWVLGRIGRSSGRSSLDGIADLADR